MSLPTMLLFTQNLLKLFSLKNPTAIHDNLAIVLGHRTEPLAAALVRLTDDIVVNLGPAEPEHLLLQGKSGEGEL